MNKIQKTLIALGAALALVLSMAACGQVDNGENSTKPQNVPQTTAPSSDPTESTPTEDNPTEPSADATIPSVTEPPTTEPVVTEPSATEPDETEPDTTAPDTETTLPTEPSEVPEDHQHSYVESVVAATCTEDGYTTYTCECGDQYTGDGVSAKGHSWSGWSTTKEPTTTSTGKAERKCAACGTTENRTLDKVIVNHTHSYTSKVTKKATCTSKGQKTYTCSCGSSYTESIDKISHSYTSAVTKPTCTEDGYTTYVCSGCGSSYKDNYVTGQHSYGEWSVEKKTPQYAQLVRQCSICGREDLEFDYSQKMTQEEILQDVLRLVNIEREKAGVAPLQYYYEGQAAADIRAAEIMELFSHTRPDGRSCYTALTDCGVDNYFGAGENIAMGYITTENVMKGWMNSSGHKANILAEGYTHIVIGYQDNHWVQLFLQILE